MFTLEPLGGRIGVEFFPSEGQDILSIELTMPVGTRLEITRDILLQLSDIAMEEIQGINDLFLLVGTTGDFNEVEMTNVGQLVITLPTLPERIESAKEMDTILSRHYDKFPSAQFISSSGNSQTGSEPIDIVIRSGDLDIARRTANAIKEILDNSVEEVIEPSITQSDGRPTASVVIDRNKTYSLGLTIGTVAREISAAVGGTSVGRFRYEGDEIDMILLLREEDRNSIPDLDSLFVINQSGSRIPISSIASVKRISGPVSINREDRSRAIHVTAKINPDFSLNAADAAVRKAIKNSIALEEGVILSYAGDFEELQKAGKISVLSCWWHWPWYMVLWPVCLNP